MLVFGLFLIPVIFAAPDVVTRDCCVLKIQGPALVGIEIIGEPTDSLDLSGVQFGRIEPNVFDNLTHIKSLNLARTGLAVLQPFRTRMKNLEYLSLADNDIDEIDRGDFSGLRSLKFLNISGNQIKELSAAHLYGLGKGVNISASMDSDQLMLHTLAFEDFDGDDQLSTYDPYHGPWTYWADDLSVICIRDGIVEKLEPYEEPMTDEPHCKVVHFDTGSRYVHENLTRYLHLKDLGISKFTAGWYRLNRRHKGIDLSNNNITEITAEFLNDLPATIININLSNNKIVSLKNGIILNENLKFLDFTNNSIGEIEDGALAKPKLLSLNLHKNRLNDTRFVTTLPESLQSLNLSDNYINELLPDVFSRFHELDNIDFAGNNINVIKSESLRGLDPVESLNLARNGIENIEINAFRHLTSLRNLNLAKNNLSTLEKGVFFGLQIGSPISVDLSSNNFKKIIPHFFFGLTNTLRALSLSFNQIEILEAGTFASVPKDTLQLNNNKIKKIENGAFDLTTLKSLSLANNQLDRINGDEFAHLDNLQVLDLSNNGITKIEKGFAKHLGKVTNLDLSNNPFKRLENGALFGLTKYNYSFVQLNNIRLELLQGGVFDDL